jgi:GABA permease
VENPFRSEGAAFRFLWVVIAYAAVVVAASWIDGWFGVAVAVALAAFGGWFLFVRGRGEPPVKHAPAPSPPGEHRVLVVADEALGGPELTSELGRRENVVVHVVAPATTSLLKTLTSDEDEARAAAQRRLDESVASMRAAGFDVSGEVGDADPVQAAEDAMRSFRPDELVVSTQPEGRSTWLEQDVVARIRERLALPVTHVVSHLDADQR